MNKLKKFLPILLVLCVLTVVYSAKQYQYDDPALNSEIENIYLQMDRRPIGARAYASATNPNVASATWTSAQLNTENFDIGGDFNTTTYKFTVPVTGYYHISAGICWRIGVVSKKYMAAIWKNGGFGVGTEICRSVLHMGSVSNDDLTNRISDVVYLEIGDTIQLEGYHTSGVDTVDMEGGSKYTYMSIFLLAKT